jgi:hypothetical protein
LRSGSYANAGARLGRDEDERQRPE